MKPDDIIFKELPGDSSIPSNIFFWPLAQPFYNLSSRLSYMDHREDALKAIQQAVEIYQQLAAERPTAFNPDLARSLNILSLLLADLGHREDGLKAIQQAVEIHQQLAAKTPAVFNP